VVLPAAQLTTLTPPAAITGFATAANQVTELSSLSSIDTKTPALGQALAAASVPIVLTALQLTALTPPAAISGYATSAKQDTGNVSLSSIDGKITAVNTGAVVISSGVLTTVGAVTAITNALPAGSNAIGKLAANSGVIIGAVEIAASQTIGIAAGSAVIGHIILDSGAVNATLAAETTKVIGTVNVAASQTIGLAAGAAVIGHVIVDSGSITIGAALPAGTNGIGKLTANSGVTIGAVEIAAAQTLGLVAGTALVGKVGLDQTTPGTTNAVADQPVTSGGLSISSFLSTAAVQSTAVKASAGQVYGLRFFNIGAGPVYVRLYNQTTAPGSGDTPVWRGIVPGNTAGAGFSLTFDKGLAFGTGIGLRVTGAIADNDTTALAANVVIGDVEYK
jgi:hypothetical protein